MKSVENLVNNRGMHDGEPVGYPSNDEQGEIIFIPGRIKLRKGPVGNVITDVNLGFVNTLVGDVTPLQRVLPGFENEMTEAVDREERRVLGR